MLAALVDAGKLVWLPFHASGRCDLVFEDDTGFHRVQCKAGALRGDVVTFKTCSQTRNVPKDYRNDVDFFGVYCRERREVYLVPVDAVSVRGGTLRLRPARNGQMRGLRWAADYLLG